MIYNNIVSALFFPNVCFLRALFSGALVFGDFSPEPNLRYLKG